MNKADLWLGTNAPNAQPGNTELRGYDTARTIQARPAIVVISRRDPDTTQTIFLPPQTVRLEIFQNVYGAKELLDPMAIISRQYVVLMAYKDCLGYPDTDIQRADQFFYKNLLWEVVEFNSTIPGRLLASCELTP